MNNDKNFEKIVELLFGLEGGIIMTPMTKEVQLTME